MTRNRGAAPWRGGRWPCFPSFLDSAPPLGNRIKSSAKRKDNINSPRRPNVAGRVNASASCQERKGPKGTDRQGHGRWPDGWLPGVPRFELNLRLFSRARIMAPGRGARAHVVDEWQGFHGSRWRLDRILWGGFETRPYVFHGVRIGGKGLNPPTESQAPHLSLSHNNGPEASRPPLQAN